MTRTVCIILGLAFMALGILGITGSVPIFKSDPTYINVVEIVLGSLGFLVGYLPSLLSRTDAMKALWMTRCKGERP